MQACLTPIQGQELFLPLFICGAQEFCLYYVGLYGCTQRPLLLGDKNDVVWILRSYKESLY